MKRIVSLLLAVMLVASCVVVASAYSNQAIVELKATVGDADGDGVLSILDATEIQLFLSGLKAMDETYFKRSDADGDGVLSIMDATHVQLILAGLREQYVPTYTYCDKCRTSVTSPHFYDGLKLCYSCYNNMKNTKCDYCRCYISSARLYNGYKLCGTCYINLAEGSSCDNCGKTVTTPYYEDGYTVCYSCYMSNDFSICYYCGDRGNTYKTVEISGYYRPVCYTCYNIKHK